MRVPPSPISLVVSSATLEADKFKEFFSTNMAPVATVGGRTKSRWGAAPGDAAGAGGGRSLHDAPAADALSPPTSAATVLSLVGRQYPVGTVAWSIAV